MGMNMSVIYLDSGCPSGDGYRCDIFIEKYPIKKDIYPEKIILLNALVPVSDKPAIIISTPITVEEAKVLVNKAQFLESYIGHEATAKLFSIIFERLIPVNRGIYVPNHEDLAIVIRLKKRLEKPEDIKNVTVNDIELLLVRYYTRVDIIEHKY
jgi:hypothetical protein